jgi:hypothetical protein
MKMNREAIIKSLKEGFNVQNVGKRFISFGQMPPEVQAVAREIGPLEFEYLRPDGTFAMNLEQEFHKHITYHLRADWQDKPKEDKPKKDEYNVYPVIDCREIIDQRRCGRRMRWRRILSFAGYGYKKPDGEIEWTATPIAFKDPSDNLYSWGMTNRKLVHCDFVRVLKKGE